MKYLRGLLRHGFGGIHEGYAFARHILEERLQERVVGAAEDQGVDVAAQDRAEVFWR